MTKKVQLVVYIIDQDSSVRNAISLLLHSRGIENETFESVKEFLDSGYRQENACVIADVDAADSGGFELAEALTTRGALPVIFLTTFHNKQARRKAKKAGAVCYLQKPVDDQALHDAILWAVTAG